MPMNRMFTHDYLCLEEEATRLLSVYETYADDKLFESNKALQSLTIKLKSFARSYQFTRTNACDIEYVSN